MAEFLQLNTDLASENIGDLNLIETVDDLELNSHSSLMKGISAEVVDVNLSKKYILNDDEKMAWLNEMEENGVKDVGSLLNVEDVYKILKERGVVGDRAQKKIRFLSLAFASIDNETFKELTEKLESVCFVENDGILDLSYNALTPSSVPHMIRWIDRKGIRFINIFGNAQCSTIRVANICKSLKVAKDSNMEEVRRIMKHIVFLPMYYIYHASTQVKLFRQLHELGYLPDSWAEDQREYYRSISKERVSFPEYILDGDPRKDASFNE